MLDTQASSMNCLNNVKRQAVNLAIYSVVETTAGFFLVLCFCCFLKNRSRLIRFTSWTEFFVFVACRGIVSVWLLLLLLPIVDKAFRSASSTILFTTTYPKITGREKYTEAMTNFPALPRGDSKVFCLQ